MDRLAGSTDQSVSFAAFTTATGAAVTVTSATAGLSLWYRRGNVGAKVLIAPSNLAAINSAHADGGLIVIESQEHRLDLPDAAFAAGVDYLEWGGSATGITIDGGSCNLIGQPTTGSVGTPLTSEQTKSAAAAAIAAAGIATEAKQDEILAAIASAGVGARTCVITVDDGTDPLESARVRVTKGAESWLQTTGVSGQATFNLDDGSWTVAITLAGYMFSGDILVVDGNETETYSMTAAGFTPSVEPDSVTVRWRVKGKDRATVGAGEATVYVAVQDGPGTAGEIWSGHEDSDTTDANGYVEFTNVPIPCTLLVRAGADGVAREVAIPATAKSPYNAGELTNQDVD